MDARILFDALRQRGVTLAVVGDELRYRPKRAVDETTLALLRQHKAALVELLEEEQRRGEAVRYDQGPAEGALPASLGNRVAALLDKLRAHGCQVEALGDGQTVRADCPSCRMAAALDLSEGTDGLPVIRSRCRCFDPLAALEGREAVSLAEFRQPKASPPQRPPKPKRPDAVCPCGSTKWRDVPIHGGRSIRRDCARCGRFLGFPLWYGQPEGGDQARAPSGSQPAPSQPTPTYWPSWAQLLYEKLQRAGCHPKVAISRGNGGQSILAIEATCPGCGWVGGLSAWPLATGAIHAHCRAGCRPAEVFAGLDRRLERS
jgi:hypothetical protein